MPINELLSSEANNINKFSNQKQINSVKVAKLDVQCRFCRYENKGMTYNRPCEVHCIQCSSFLTELHLDNHYQLKQPPDFFEGYIPGGHTRMAKDIIFKNINDKGNRFSSDHANDELIIASWFNTYKRITYFSDPPGMDIWNKAEKTWRTRKGDCEDHSILLTDFLISQGFNARVAVGLYKKEGHAWVVLQHRNKEYLLEQIGNLSQRFPPRIETYAKDYEPHYSFDKVAVYYPIKSNKKVLSYFSETSWYKLTKQK